ncbi:hypothetical protein SDC9_199934 [bioreactor metagenome]|uniref:Uncharacterized protein n=1 Tax=bioreactor metagenome TaxID=1076179 RepID=A0A645ILV9_9ZZZZ
MTRRSFVFAKPEQRDSPASAAKFRNKLICTGGGKTRKQNGIGGEAMRFTDGSRDAVRQWYKRLEHKKSGPPRLLLMLS